MSALLSRMTPLSSSSLGDPAPPPSDTPGTTQAAIACLVVFSIVTAVRVSWYTMRATPVQGSQMQAGRDFSRGYHRTMPLITALVALLLKLIALGLDTWAIQSHDGITIKMGVLEAHEGGGRSDSWATLCRMGFLDRVSCNTVRAGGILTMLSGIASLSTGLVYSLLALKAMRSPIALSQLAPRLYRVSGLAHTFTTGMFLFWLLGSWLILDDQLSWISFGASWWICLAAMVLDAMVHSSARRALVATLPPERIGHLAVAEYAGQYQPPQAHIPYAVPVAYAQPQQQGGYAQMQPQQMQPQQQYAPAGYQPVVYGQPQVPAGYGAPQPPPAFNPYSAQ